MPDHKRLNAPDNTVPYQYHLKKDLQKKFAIQEKREDDRNHKEHRKICTYSDIYLSIIYNIVF